MSVNLPNIVTRFIANKRFFDTKNEVLEVNVFYTNSNMQNGEISVFDIDEELNDEDEEKIFLLGDNSVYRGERKTLARADLGVERINNIIVNENLFLDYNGEKHCNIRPFPNDDALALLVAGELVKISNLQIRQK